MERQEYFRSSLIYVVSAIAVPAATYVGIQLVVAYLARLNPHVNYGAAIVALLVFGCSIVAAAALLGHGIQQLLRGLKSRK